MYSREETQRFLAERVARPGSSSVIVLNANGEALVLKAHYKAYWSFPGGWIEHGQTPREAGIRELGEETGIVLREDDVRLSFVVDRKSDLMQTYQFVFEAAQRFGANQAITLQANEISDYRYVSKAYVLAQENEFGGAVIEWANSSPVRYFEHTL